MRAQTGKPFEIFQDRDDIAWGEQWRARIETTIDAVTFLIPVVTPSFFTSEPCRSEFERFLSRENELERDDLILPIYYIDSEVLANNQGSNDDHIVRELLRRQWTDWRNHRFQELDNPDVKKLIASMASHLRSALSRKSEPLQINIPEIVPHKISGKFADDRLNRPIDFGATLDEISSRFKSRMDEFNAIDGSTNDKFLNLGAYVYTCVASSLDLVITKRSTTPESRSILESISRRLKRLANYDSDYLTKNPFPKYWADGTELAIELMDHCKHLDRTNY
ncbi:MAG: hypothetical protein Tsb009_09910 [Planctomycetaceae bacterium]